MRETSKLLQRLLPRKSKTTSELGFAYLPFSAGSLALNASAEILSVGASKTGVLFEGVLGP